MADLTVVYRAVGDLKPYERNARTHSDEQIAQIAASIQAFGWTNPVLVDEAGGIIAGHGRLAAALSLGHETVPTICIAGLSDVARRALILADNKLALNAGWDEHMLAAELDELQGFGLDVKLIGFTAEELAALVGTPNTAPGLTDEDAVPEVPEDPVSRLGDVWVLGRHRIACGDCTDAAVVDAALGASARVDVCFTSPPYGAGNVAKLRDHYIPGAETRKSFYKEHTDDPRQWRRLMDGWFDIAIERCDFVMCNVQMLADNKRDLVAWVNRSVDKLCDVVIWDKGHGAPQMQRNVLNNAFEFVYLFGGNGSRAVPFGDFHGSASNVVRINPKEHPNEVANDHRAVMPVDMALWALRDLCAKAKTVYEPFSGSGTTIIAAEMTGRSCHAIELSPAYVDVAVKRWQAFTGKRAVLEATGEPFPTEDGNPRPQADTNAPEAGHRQPRKARAPKARGEAAAV